MPTPTIGSNKEAPTAAMVKSRFPLFEPVSDDLIDTAIERAVMEHDTNRWPVRAYQYAMIYYALHLLYMSGEPKRSMDLVAEVEADHTTNKDTVTGVNSITVGPLTVGLKTDNNSVNTSGAENADAISVLASEFDRSSYGRNYLMLRNRYLRKNILV